jgi:anti-sigma factor RsiW
VTHDDLKDLTMALHDGQLSPSDKALAETHLAECPECRRELESWRRAAKTLFQETPVAPSEMFVQRVMRGIEPEGRPTALARSVTALARNAVRERPAWEQPSAWARLRSLSGPRWAWAGAFAAAATALWLFLPRSPIRPISAEKPDIAAEMSDVSVDAIGSETDGYGTAVESYWL